MGGFPLATVWHRAFAVVMLGYSAIFAVWAFKVVAKHWHKRWRIVAFGPDSPVLNLQDVRDLFGMFCWFLGLGPRPGFERWTYWEKFDFWTIVFMVVFIGTSGLIMWWPNFFGLFLSGASINLAQMIHSEVALVATSILLAIHFFNTHFRPEKFPMDLSVLTGLVNEEHLERARPRFLERMRREGKLDELRTTIPSPARLWALTIGGGLVHLLAVVLLLAILYGSMGG
jgi:cytochrome b subunit of formate dehydrogenase